MMDAPIAPHLSARIHTALDVPVGYHGACWYDTRTATVDRDTPDPLAAFLAAVRDLTTRLPHAVGGNHIGPAYLRVIDAAHPDHGLRWHRDLPDGGVRLTTAIATDGHPVNVATTIHPALEHQPTSRTRTGWHQPANGRLVVFTTDIHGVPPLPPRPGQRTAVFFATLYPTREHADLHSTRCHTPNGTHPHTPVLAKAG